jgi:DNA polymerase III delta prime subunit
MENKSPQTNNIQAQLIVGNQELLASHVETFLQKTFCPTLQANPEQSGCFCTECRRIKNRQHPLIVWIYPEKDYTVDDIEIIFDRVRFTLENNQPFFFVLDKVQTLTDATANRLLKVLEEPPTGYHFILLTTNTEAILPTIISRCVVVELEQQALDTPIDQHPLCLYLFNPDKRNDPLGFEAELRKQGLNDTLSTDLLQQMIAHITLKIRTAHSNNQSSERLALLLTHLLKTLRKPPQSGSSDIFWKNLFLNLPRS